MITMKYFICANCMNNFMHSVFEYEFVYEYSRFQMLKCPHCDHILYWSESRRTNVAKLFEDYNERTQIEIIIDLSNEEDTLDYDQ